MAVTMHKAWENRIVGYGEEAPDQLMANPRNARIHPKFQQDALKGVLDEVGWVQNVIVNRASGAIVDGHLRVTLAMRHDQPLVPVTYVDLTDAQEAEILATLDPITALAVYDKEQLDALLHEVQSGEAGVQAMLAELAKDSGLYQEPKEAPEPQVDRAEELRAKWGTERGQVWQVGRHRLMCGDSLSAENIRRLVAGDVVNMVFADPPYGISIVATDGYVGGGERYNIPFGGVKNRRLGTVGGSKPFGSQKVRGTDGASHVVEAGKYAPVIGDDSTRTAIEASTLLLAEYQRAVHIWWGGNYYANALPASSCWLVWDKETTGNFADCELAWTNQDRAARLFRHQWNGMLRESERGRRVHPTQKPVALAVWAYEALGAEGDVILDPFCGSGMTMLAAEQTGRTALAIEMSEDYVAVALERMAGMGLEPRLVETKSPADEGGAAGDA